MRYRLGQFVLTGLAVLVCSTAWAGEYVQNNLVTDNQSITPAAHTDPNLVNPWGISFRDGPAGTGSPFWVSNQGTQTATLYNGAGVPQALFVNIPPSGSFGPTGQVFNSSTTNFIIPSDGTPAAFIFANLNGSISAWNSGLGTTPGTFAQVVAQPTSGASLTGLALANGLLYAADKGNNTIDVYNSSFGLSSMIKDMNPNVSGLTPYNVQLLSDGRLYVAFENKSNPNEGAVEILTNGTFQTLVLSTDTHLKEPWGLALAPSSFGQFGGDLLVGNKFDGTINAYNPTTGAYVGTLTDPSGKPIADPGLWGLAFGTGSQGFDPNTLYFAAGVGFVPGGLGNDIYAHGLFGSISVVPEPASGLLLLLGISGLGLIEGLRRQYRKR